MPWSAHWEVVAAPPARPVTIGVIAPSIQAAEGLRRGFHELGYVEGRNLRLEYRWILGVPSIRRDDFRRYGGIG